MDKLGDLLRDAEHELRCNETPSLADAVARARELLETGAHSEELVSGIHGCHETSSIPGVRHG